MEYTNTAAPQRVRVNLRRDAWSVDAEDVRLSWRLPAGWAAQTAYRVRLYQGTDPAYGRLVLETDWIPDDRYLARALPGTLPGVLPGMLTPGGVYAVCVAVRSGDGQDGGLPNGLPSGAPFGGQCGLESGWSAPCAFSVAPETDGGHAVWARDEAGAIPPSCFVRQSFFLTDDEVGTLDRVLVTAAGRSPEAGRQYVYTLWANGQALGVGATREGMNPDKVRLIYTQTFDATAAVRAGENVLAAILTDPGDGRMFLCTATAYFRDGTRRELLDASGWLGLDGTAALRPCDSLGTGYFRAYASNIDATAYPFGFTEPGFDASGWLPCADRGDITAASDDRDGYRLAPSTADPVRRFVTETVPTVVKLAEGHYAVDFGREFIGSFGLRVPGGWSGCAEVKVYFGEQCRPEGAGADGTVVKWNMQTSNRYTESWRLLPDTVVETTDMVAVRFLEFIGLPFDLAPDMVYGVAIRRAFDGGEAALETDVPLLRDMYTLMRRTVEVTTQDIYVDSQSRERGAYEGDALINQFAAYAFEDDDATCRFSLEFLYTHRTWPAEYILLICEAAWQDYMATGDDRSLRAYWQVLRDKQFARFTDPGTGLLHSGNPGGSGTDAILVDWPGSERDGYDMSVTYNTVFNCVSVVGFRALAKIAGVLGEAEAEKAFADRAESLRVSLIRRVYDPVTGDVYDGLSADGVRSAHVSQHAMAYALYAGIYETQADADRIADRLWERCGGKIRMSVYGAFFLLMGLYRAGHGDRATRMLLDPADTLGERTWAYMLHRSVGEGTGLPFGTPDGDGRALGATVTTEAWNSRNKPNMTYSHPWGAAPAAAIVQGIFGIEPTEPGYRRFTVHPQPGDIQNASLSLPTASGVIRVTLRDGKPIVEAPAGTAYTVL